MKKKTEHHFHEEHFHWQHIDKFFKIFLSFLIGLILLTNSLNILTNEITKEEIIYKKCVDVCGKKTTYKFYDVGKDYNLPDLRFFENNINECVASCNELYLKLNILYN